MADAIKKVLFPVHNYAPHVNLESGSIISLDMELSSNFFLELGETAELRVTNLRKGVCVLYVTHFDNNLSLLLEENYFRTALGDPLSISAVYGSIDMLTFLCDGTQVFVTVTKNWKQPYEQETLDYMLASGADVAVRDSLDAWIKGLKFYNAWDTAVMWILRDAYQGSGATVHSLGGAVNHNGAIDNGSGTVTVGENEYLFDGVGAQVKVTGTDLLPVSPLLSLMLVMRNPEFYTHFGAGFGGERTKLNVGTYAGHAVGDSASANCLTYGSTAVSGGASGAPSATRSCKLITVTGQRAGSASINGAAAVAGETGTVDYSSFARSANTTIAGNPAYATPGDSAVSFVCLWTTNQMANTSTLYNLFKTTIGTGLSLP